MEQKITLSAIIERAFELEQQIIENQGEITDALQAHINALQEDFMGKCGGYAALCEKMDYSASYYREKAEEYRRIAKGIEGSKDRLREALKVGLETLGVEEVVSGDVKIKLQNSPVALEILDASAIPSSMKKIIVEPDTAAIKTAIKGGEKVPGAKLVQNKHIRFYPNRKAK